MEVIRIGTEVDIKRTDGRVHNAIVSAINFDSQSVTVEWFERGETKGKEVELDAIQAINPNLILVQGTDEATPPPIGTVSKKDARRTVFQSPKPPPPQAQMPPPSAIPPPRPMDPATKIRPTANRQSLAPPIAVANGHHDDTVNIRNNNNAIKREVNSLPPPVDPNKDKRRSTTVQEIDRLKANREERRLRQQEARQQKQEFLESGLEVGSAQFEFNQMIQEYRATIDYRPLHLNDQIEDHQICVCVRKRPRNRKELDRKEIDVVTVPNRDHVIVHQPMSKVDLTKYLENQTFRFDYAFDDEATNDMVYRFTAQPLVKTIFEGGMATCFAYGQTGSGKTHTMGGDFNGRVQDASKGIYAFTARDVFKILHKQYRNQNLTVFCSFFEVYSGKVFDLLNNKTKLRVLEDGKQQVQVVGLTEKEVQSEEDVGKLIVKGSEVRTAGQTSANSQSSRSHAVFQIIIKKRGMKKIHGKFSLIDLAGNERGADTSSSNRQTRMEGAEINKSLLALKECIRALGRKTGHLPFRASKLTMVLRDSFVGENARTCMISMISPGMHSCEHTLNTLRYADRVKELGAQPADAKNGGYDEDYDGRDESDRDLALLHSHAEGELSDDLYNYQMDINHLQEMEDQIVVEHGQITDEQKTSWCKEDEHLLRQTEAVDYDVEKYAEGLEHLIARKLDRLTKFKAQVQEFRRQLTAEEQTAKIMTTNSARKAK